VITICPELAKRAVTKCGSRPHAMIENTADNTKVFGNMPEDLHGTLGLHGKKVILYTGTFEAYQGIDLLLGAFARMRTGHPRSHLLLVGGRPEQIEKYHTKVETLDLTDAVTFVGSVHPSRIPAFLRVADLIVSPRSHGTNTPLKIYEYMRSGRPLVATNLLTHTQILDAETALLVPPTEIGLADGMAKILDDLTLGRRLAEAAAARARTEFSDENYLSKVTAFYKQVLDASGHRVDRLVVRI
jgi:glycosyltransferase involved in cell wall biosynthesis